MNEEKKIEINHWNLIWSFFSSIKVAVVLILILAILSVAGTVIPQGQSPEFYGLHYSPVWVKVFLKLGLNDHYNSSIYLFILSLIGISISVCSIEYFNRRLKKRKISSLKISFNTYKGERFANFSIPLSLEETRRVTEKYLQKKGFQITEDKDEENRIHLLAEKGKLKLWGPFIVHISILVIFLGALYGGFTGFKEQITLFEGIEGEDIYTEKNNTFSVRLKEFYVEVDDKHRIKDYFSELEVLEEGEKVLEKAIEVNNPLVYKGITFYQSAWGVVGLELAVTSPEGEKELYQIILDENGQPVAGYNFFALPNKWIVKIDDFSPDILIKDSEYVNLSPFPVNPAVSFTVSKDFFEKHTAGEDALWENPGLLYLEEQNTVEYENYIFVFNRVYEYSVIDIKKDPGIPVVYFGCFLMMAGLIMAFYIKQTVMRFCIVYNKDNETHIYTGYTGKKDDYEKEALENIKKDILTLIRSNR